MAVRARVLLSGDLKWASDVKVGDLRPKLGERRVIHVIVTRTTSCADPCRLQKGRYVVAVQPQ